jgi:hypothetical protein
MSQLNNRFILKYIHIQYHYTRQLIAEEFISVTYCDGHQYSYEALGSVPHSSGSVDEAHARALWQ